MSAFPYPGLRAFHRHETDIFFGREKQTDELLEKLDHSRFLAVVGPSGCGKSSLVRAGMIAALETGFLASAGARWRVAEMRPGNRPLKTLSEALLGKSVLGPERAGEENAVAFLHATLRRGPLGLAEVLRETPLPERTNLLLLVDQFEELFRYRQHGSRDEADAFVALLLTTAAQRDVPVYVVITMRSDFLGDCALFEGLPGAINEGQYLTPRLTREQRRAAIVGPAEVFGGKVEPALVNRLLNDMGADPDQLPLMQHVLMRLWTYTSDAVKGPSAELDIATSAVDVGDKPGGLTLSLANYEVVGGLAKALSNHADKAFADLDDEQQRIAEVLFRCLSERGVDQRDTRRAVRLGEVAAVAGVAPEEVAAVVEVFRRRSRSFITPPFGAALNDDIVLDISHESLIRQWERMNKWVEQEGASAETYRHLERTARRWEKGEARLWGTPDLDIALAWKAGEKPTPGWAQRYGTDFELAMGFLDASERRRKDDEAAARREIKERARNLFEPLLNHASLLARTEDYGSASKVLAQSRELDEEVPAERRRARNLVAWFADLMGGTAAQTYTGAGVPLLSVALSRDGRLLGAVGEKGTVVLFDADTGKVLKRWQGHKHDAYGVVFHPEGQWLATAGDDRRIVFWSLRNQDKLREWRRRGKLRGLAISRDGRRLASCINKNVILWDTKTGKVLQTLKGHTKEISPCGLTFSPDGCLLASASDDQTARLWDLKTGKRLRILRGHTDSVCSVAFSPDGQLLATSSADNTVRLWQVASGKHIRVFRGHQNEVFALAFVDYGRRLVSASRDRTLRVWDTDSGITLRVFQGHTGTVAGLAADAERLFSASIDGNLRRWNKHLEESQRDMRVVDLSPGVPNSCAISPDGSSVAVGFENGGLRLCTLPEAHLRWEQPEAHADIVCRLAFSPDGKHLASASFDNTVKLWQASDGQLQESLSGHSDALYAVTFAPDGKSLASASYDGQIGLFELGKKNGRFYPAHKGQVHSVAFDASGQHLVSAGGDGETRLWNLRTWPPISLQSFSKAQDMVFWATFNPDGSLVASVGRDNLLHILCIGGGDGEQVLTGHENTIFRVDFSPDGRQVVTVSGDASIRLWDLTAAAELFTLCLPMERGDPGPWDFAFRCTPKETGGDCWIAVPLPRGKLVLYHLGQIYE